MLVVTSEIAFFLGIIGAAMGSFACAVAWRLHTGRNFINERSECETCHHKLGVLDLIPVLSWLALRGKCRYCNASIGATTLITEVSVAILFVVSFLYWPLGFGAWQAIALFLLWLLYVVLFAILVVYDARWMLLPDTIVWPLIGMGFIDAALRLSLLPGANLLGYLLYVAEGILALAGVYGVLRLILHPKSYEWRFVTPSRRVLDRGGPVPCH